MRAVAHHLTEMLVGLAAALPLIGCAVDDPEELGIAEQSVGDPSPDQVPLDPATIPRFAHELPIPRVFAPTVITDRGRVIRHEYTVNVVQTEAQLLPPGFPPTRVLAYSGPVKIAGSTATEIVASSPGPVFDNTRGIPSLVRWRNGITGPHFLPIDPTLN